MTRISNGNGTLMSSVWLKINKWACAIKIDGWEDLPKFDGYHYWTRISRIALMTLNRSMIGGGERRGGEECSPLIIIAC